MNGPPLPHGLPYVLFRYPGDTYYYIFQPGMPPQEKDEIHEPGFYLAPFAYPTRKAVFLPLQGATLRRFPFPSPFQITTEAPFIAHEGTPVMPDHPGQVRRTVEYIRQSPTLRKVVISNRLDIQPVRTAPQTLFYAMACRYPKAFVYYVHLPEEETDWAGATPEVLLSFHRREENGVFHAQTYSLAGTRHKNFEEWTSKEREEQQIVTEYIKQILLETGVPFSLSGPSDLTQGSLVHLLTVIDFLVPPEISMESLLRRLHPTPAVAGMPKPEALRLIPHIETFDREFYTGFVGVRDEKGGTFYVNLRSMRITPRRISLYAGGGITAASIPEREWLEVQRKWDILRRILRKPECSLS